MAKVRGTGASFLFGFFLGAVGGCFGLVLAPLLDSEYLPGAIVGFMVQTALGVVAVIFIFGDFTLMVVPEPPTEIERLNLDGTPVKPEFPWAIVASVIAGAAVLTGGIAAAVWTMQNSADDDSTPPYTGYPGT